jgi:hypothetical protein
MRKKTWDADERRKSGLYNSKNLAFFAAIVFIRGPFNGLFCVYLRESAAQFNKKRSEK